MVQGLLQVPETTAGYCGGREMVKKLLRLFGIDDGGTEAGSTADTRDAYYREQILHLSRTIDAVDAFYRHEINHLKSELAAHKDGQAQCADVEAQLGQLSSACIEMAGFTQPPPKHLQQRVVGGYDKAFLASGYRLAGDVETILQSHGKSLGECQRVFEWGCGCGRSLRAMKNLHPHLELFGTDIDAEAITWLQQHYAAIAQFKTNDHEPPIAFADRSFDLIYAVSVFTHLPEEMQFRWLADLARLLQPGGIALLSVHGESHHHKQSSQAQQILEDRGFYYDTGAHRTDGLPEFYLNTYHTAEYIKREWSSYFTIREIVPLGFEGHQDVVVASAKS